MGARIKEQRLAHNWTQADLGEKLGVKRQAVCKWEKGNCKYLDRYKINLMADLFKCDPGWLMDMNDTDKVDVVYSAPGKESVRVVVSNANPGKPMIGKSAQKVKLYDTVLKIKPEYYDIAIRFLESLT